jgi:predicted nuclease of predicted toxin-antitoxin system
VAAWLRDQGHEVFSVHDEAPGLADSQVLQKAAEEGWLLITNDRDFGELVFREQRRHHGVILLRLQDERSVSKIATLSRLLEGFGSQISGRFVVVSETTVRFAG